MMESLVPDYLAYGVKRERVGGRMEGIAPSNAYLCADGASIIVAGNGDAIFQRYMETIGRPDLAADPDLQTNAGRWRRREELDAAIGEWTIQYDRDEALKLLDAAGVPSGPDLHRRRHLRRRAVRGPQHDPALRRRHRRGRAEDGRLPRHRPGDRRQPRCRFATSDPTSASTPARSWPRCWDSSDDEIGALA